MAQLVDVLKKIQNAIGQNQQDIQSLLGRVRQLEERIEKLERRQGIVADLQEQVKILTSRIPGTDLMELLSQLPELVDDLESEVNGHQLGEELAQLRQDVDNLMTDRVAAPALQHSASFPSSNMPNRPGIPRQQAQGRPTTPGDLVYYKKHQYRFRHWGGINCRIETLDGQPAPDLGNQRSAKCPINEVFQDQQMQLPIRRPH